MDDWHSLGGVWITPPHAVSVDADTVALFVVGIDHQLYVRWRLKDRWGDWECLGATLATSISAVVSPGGDKVDVFAVTNAHAITHRTWHRGHWSPWQSLGGEAGGPTMRPPRAAWTTPNRLELFVLGTDLSIWHRCRHGGDWQATWDQLAVLMLTPPYVVTREPGVVDLISISAQSALSYLRFRNGTFGRWRTLNSDETVISLPNAVSSRDGRLHVFALGEKRGLYHHMLADDDEPVSAALEGKAVLPPKAVASGSDDLDVFVVGEDSALWHRSRRDGDWRWWASLGGEAYSVPSLVEHGDSVELFILGRLSDIQVLRLTV